MGRREEGCGWGAGESWGDQRRASETALPAVGTAPRPAWLSVAAASAWAAFPLRSVPAARPGCVSLVRSSGDASALVLARWLALPYAATARLSGTQSPLLRVRLRPAEVAEGPGSAHGGGRREVGRWLRTHRNSDLPAGRLLEDLEQDPAPACQPRGQPEVRVEGRLQELGNPAHPGCPLPPSGQQRARGPLAGLRSRRCGF